MTNSTPSIFLSLILVFQYLTGCSENSGPSTAAKATGPAPDRSVIAPTNKTERLARPAASRAPVAKSAPAAVSTKTSSNRNRGKPLPVVESKPVAIGKRLSLRLCTGAENGNYHAAAGVIAKLSQTEGIEIKLVTTGGSMDNFRQMSKGACDGAIVQSDAHYVFTQELTNKKLAIELISALFDEFVYLVCNEKSKVKNIKSFKEKKNQSRLLIGPRGSGSNLAWQTFSFMDFKYAKAKTMPIGGRDAITEMLTTDKGYCLLNVSGLKSPEMEAINSKAKGNILRLLPINDGKFDNKRDKKGRRIYRFASIKKGTYPSLQRKRLTGVKTLELEALLVMAQSWLKENKTGYERLQDVLAKAKASGKT